MGKEIIMFGDFEVEKHNLHQHKRKKKEKKFKKII